MPLRFSKRISLGKFLRLNLSKSGVGITLGVPGAHVTAGPRGTRLTLGVPGTGLSYSQKIDPTAVGSFAPAPGAGLPTTALRDPGPFAPDYEKELVKGLNELNSGKIESALTYFLAAAPQEFAAALYAAYLLAGQPEGQAQAVTLLEGVVSSDAKLPTVLMQKYLATATIPVAISPTVSAQVPVTSSAAPLLLAELYQAQGQIDEAIGLLEEIAELSTEAALSLSLCELLASKGEWAEIIQRAQNIQPADDVTFETKIWYGRALLEQGIAEGALSMFTEMLRKKKSASPGLVVEARYWRAVTYDKLGKKSQANKEFQKLYAEAPNLRDVAQRIAPD